MWPFRKPVTEPPLERFLATDLVARGWHMYEVEIPPQHELLEFRRSPIEDVPFLARAETFNPEFNVADLWWRVPHIIDVTPNVYRIN